MYTAGQAVGELVALIFIVFLLSIPSIVAFRRKHPQKWAILVVNLAVLKFGPYAWFAAMIWAVWSFKKPVPKESLL